LQIWVKKSEDIQVTGSEETVRAEAGNFVWNNDEVMDL